MKDNSPANRWSIAAAWGFVGLLMCFLLLRNGGYGWDFRVYRQVTADFFAFGANPYTRIGWPLSYPPLVMHLFRPFTMLSSDTANLLWTVLKMGGFCFLIRLWHRHFLPLSPRDPFQVLFLTLAFNGALFYDIASGNVAGFQQVVLWIAFLTLLRKRVWGYVVAVVLMAEIKMDLLLLLGLLLFVDEKPRWKEMLVGFAGFLAIFSLNYWWFPDLFPSYLKLLSRLGTYNSGVNNPSTLAFCRQLIKAASTWRFRLPLPSHSGEALYAAIAILVIGLSWRAWLRMRMRCVGQDLRWCVLFFIIVFGLVDPRVPPYLYPLFLVPSLWILEEYRRPSWIPLVAVFAMFPQSDSSFPKPVNQIFQLFNVYLPLMALYGVWILYLDSSYSTSTVSAQGPSEHPYHQVP